MHSYASPLHRWYATFVTPDPPLHSLTFTAEDEGAAVTEAALTLCQHARAKLISVVGVTSDSVGAGLYCVVACTVRYDAQLAQLVVDDTPCHYRFVLERLT